MNSTIHTSDNLFCSNSSIILDLSVKFASQICHENINKPLDGTYLAEFGIDIRVKLTELKLRRQQCNALAPFLGHCQTRNEAQIVIIMAFRGVLVGKVFTNFQHQP